MLVSPQVRIPIGRQAPPALNTCLVLSASPRRAQLWVRAAHEERWTTIVCANAEDANRQAVRHRIDLALIDMQSATAETEGRFRKFVEQLARRDGPLLAVCGKPDDATSEVWSRQLGVWMYLPGIDGHSDVALLCAEAKDILQKLSDQTARTTG